MLGLKTQRKIFRKAQLTTFNLIRKGFSREKAIRYSSLWYSKIMNDLTNNIEKEEFETLKKEVNNLLM
jgi:hypothetical protein